MKNRRNVLILLIILLFNFTTYAEANSRIEVYIDNYKIEIDEEPIIKNDRVLVPMRSVFEELDIEVDWDESRKTAIAVKDDTKLELPINSQMIYINDEIQEIDTSAILVDDKTYVPIRVISETFGSGVDWDGSSRSVYINRNFNKEKVGRLNNGFATIELGMTSEQVVNALGEANRIDNAVGGGIWLIYNNSSDSYLDYIQIKLINDKVVQIQTNSENWIWNNKQLVGENSNNIESYIGSEEAFIEDYIESNIVKGTEIRVNKKARKELTADEQSVYLTMLIDNDSENVNFLAIGLMRDKNNSINIGTEGIVQDYTGYTEETLKGMEKQIFDYTNVIRVKNGLKPFKWNDELYTIAKGHSENMGINNYFSHQDANGNTFEDRLLPIARKNHWMSGAENISGGIYNAAGVTNHWYNSKNTDRKNLLANFDYLGVGVAYSRDSNHGLYFTQDFAGYNRVEE